MKWTLGRYARDLGLRGRLDMLPSTGATYNGNYERLLENLITSLGACLPRALETSANVVRGGSVQANAAQA